MYHGVDENDRKPLKPYREVAGQCHAEYKSFLDRCMRTAAVSTACVSRRVFVADRCPKPEAESVIQDFGAIEKEDADARYIR